MAGDTIVKESVAILRHGHKAVTTTVAKLAENKLPFPASKGILLRCPGSNDPAGTNTAEVWIGGPAVTADANESTGGTPIAPGEALFLPLEDPSLLFVITSGGTQDISWMTL